MRKELALITSIAALFTFIAFSAQAMPAASGPLSPVNARPGYPTSVCPFTRLITRRELGPPLGALTVNVGSVAGAARWAELGMNITP